MNECLPCRRRGFKGIKATKMIGDEQFCRLCFSGIDRAKSVKSAKFLIVERVERIMQRFMAARRRRMVRLVDEFRMAA